MTWYRRPRYNPYPQNTNSGNVTPPGANPKVFDPNIKIRLETLLANPAVQKDQWTSNFAKSLLDQYNARGCLSQKQIDVLTKQETKFDPSLNSSKNAEHEEWKKQYNNLLREVAIKISKWYKEQHEKSIAERAAGKYVNEVPFYYKNTAERVLGDPYFIPTKDEYDKLVNNRYAERYHANTSEGPKFAATDVVKLNSTGLKSIYKINFPFEDGLVINVEMPNRNVKGGYIVTVLPTGTDKLVELEERFLKKAL